MKKQGVNKPKKQIKIAENPELVPPKQSTKNKPSISDINSNNNIPSNSEIPKSDPKLSTKQSQEKDREQELYDKGLDFQSIINKFSNLQCLKHKTRNYDHINTQLTSDNIQVLYCSKCILEDEKNVRNQKQNFQSIETYLPQRIRQLSGQDYEDQLEQLTIYKNEMEAYTEHKCSKLRKQIDQDFQEIQGTVIAYCERMKKSLLDQIKTFETQKLKKFSEISNNIEKHQRINTLERHKIFDEFIQILETNFDYKNEFCLNSFLKKLKHSNPTFTSHHYSQKQQQELSYLEYDLKNNPYYNKNQEIQTIKSQIQNLLQTPYDNNTLLNFTPLPPAPNPKQTELNDLSLKSDLYQILEKKFTHPSIQKLASLPTDLKHPINSITFLNILPSTNPQQLNKFNTVEELENCTKNFFTENSQKFATASSDPKNTIRFYAFTTKHVLYELPIQQMQQYTNNAICLNLKFFQEKNLLFAAMSNNQTLVFDLQQLPQKVTLLTTLIGHTKPVRCLSVQSDYVLTLSHDQTLNIYDFSQQQQNQIQEKQNPIHTLRLQEDCRILSYNTPTQQNNSNQNKQIIIGSQTGKVYIYEIQQQNNENNNSIEIIEKQVIRASNQKITDIQLSLSQKLLFVASYSGAVCVYNLQDSTNSFTLNQKYILSKKPIFAINLFQSTTQVYYISAASWDNTLNLIDLDKKTTISDVKLNLKYKENLHFNLQGLRILQKSRNNSYLGLATGNDDSNIELLQYSFKN